MKICSIENCERKHRAKGYCHIHYLRISRRNTSELVKCLPIEERFHKGYKINEITGCWDWIKSLGSHGYAHIAERGKNLRGHRLSYEIHFGKISSGLLVLHKCDNRKCVNPKHLFLGSQKENMEDMIAKGRHPIAKKGKIINATKSYILDKHPKSKLNCIQVIEIRKLLSMGKSMLAISKLFNVSEKTIFNIKHELIWKKEAISNYMKESIETHHKIRESHDRHRRNAH